MIAIVKQHTKNWNKKIIIGGCLLVLVTIFICLVPTWNSYDPYVINTALRLQSPSLEHLFGTDQLGRDILARLSEGALYTMGTACLAIFISLVIGLPLGMLSGFLGKRFDQVFMRIIDSFVAFPDFLLAIVISGLLGPGISNVLIAVICVKWVGYARLARGIVMSEKHKDYITMSKLSGSSVFKIMNLHLKKHVFSQTVVLASLDIGKVILLIASLSYIGLGAQPPSPEWGAMLSEGRMYFQIAPHLIVFPGLMIMMVVIVFNLIGEGLREQFEAGR